MTSAISDRRPRRDRESGPAGTGKKGGGTLVPVGDAIVMPHRPFQFAGTGGDRNGKHAGEDPFILKLKRAAQGRGEITVELTAEREA